MRSIVYYHGLMTDVVAAPQVNIDEYVEELRKELEEWFEKKVSGRSDRYLLGRVMEGGKRLRPILLMLVFEALGKGDREAALDVAFALELAHNASLVHDDILDWDLNRRSKPALWRQLGIGRAVIEGHRIINLAFQTVLEKGVELSKLFLEAWERASFGVLEEMFTTTPPAKRLYLRIVQEKTASLFAVGAEAAAMIAGADEETRRLLREYGMLVGVTYQLADDYVELQRGGGLVNVLLRLQQMEDLVRRGYIALKSGRLLRFFEAARSLRSPVPFLSKEMQETLGRIDEIVDLLRVNEKYKTLLRQYPRYCIRSMLQEARAG